MSKFTEMLQKKKAPQKVEATVESLQADYNNTCAQLGQDVVRIEDLMNATDTLRKNVEDHKTKIFAILKEMPAAREKATKKAAEAKKDQDDAKETD